MQVDLPPSALPLPCSQTFSLERLPSFRSVHDGLVAGVVFDGVGTKGRLEKCDVVANKGAGVKIQDGADPFLSLCKYVRPLPSRFSLLALIARHQYISCRTYFDRSYIIYVL